MQNFITYSFLAQGLWLWRIDQFIKVSLTIFHFQDHSTFHRIASAQVRRFTKAYNQAYGKDPDNNVSALTYDSFGLLFQAIQSQGRADPESIRLGLSNIKHYAGVTGTISYDGSGDPVKSVVILKVKDGKANFYELFEPISVRLNWKKTNKIGPIFLYFYYIVFGHNPI